MTKLYLSLCPEKSPFMERLRTFRTIIWLIAGIVAIELGMLVVMLRPDSFFLWATLGLLAMMCVYLVRISLVLIKELEKKQDK